MPPRNVLFVCTGNTCRSPMAQAILAAERPDWTVGSAGVAAVEGAHASAKAIEVMQEMDLDLSAHRSRRVHRELIDSADEVLVMTPAHRRRLGELYDHDSEKVQLLADDGISDPYGADLKTYRECAQELRKAVARYLKAET